MTCTTHHYACDCREEQHTEFMAAVGKFIDVASRAAYEEADYLEALRLVGQIQKISAALAPRPKETH